MENWIKDVIEQFGYAGIFLLIALENIFPPIPSEIILTFGGFMTAQTNITVTGTIAAATLGSTVGAALLYGAGLLLSRNRFERMIDRWGGILRLKKADLDKAFGWFDRYGYWTILICRMIPLIRSLISIPAGMAKMNFPLFLLFTVIGTLIWNTILVNIGAAFGDSWETAVGYLDMYSNVVYMLIAAAVIGAAFFLIRRRKK
ncbi:MULTISPECIES: DedA family protein [Bacillus]|uniref:DedA family protein n=1 Tax=Bacillus TaxID=1386 RepID=UPI000C762E90|nr:MULTISPECIES: DedA family protein [unclassified Bacillus (in: firmicutes)]MDT0162560.1 DedA family protein [Bacillus sp. AG4(2022)]PLR74919.1 alkaline phosphatase [Bacillus sp. UMB0728]